MPSLKILIHYSSKKKSPHAHSQTLLLHLFFIDTIISLFERHTMESSPSKWKNLIEQYALGV
jgi:hypothetical protein